MTTREAANRHMIVVPPDLWGAIRHVAAEQDESVSRLVRRLLTDYLDEWREENDDD